MIGVIICVIIAIACLSQGAVEGAVAAGILAVILYFVFGKNTSVGTDTGKTAPEKPKAPEPKAPAPEHRATPSMLAHYRASPVVAQIIREIRESGALERISISRGGYELNANGGGAFYRYVFKDHGYQALSLQEQEAFLYAIIEQLPHAEAYSISYSHYENATTPLNYFASTDFYRNNQYRLNPATRKWEKMTKL